MFHNNRTIRTQTPSNANSLNGLTKLKYIGEFIIRLLFPEKIKRQICAEATSVVVPALCVPSSPLLRVPTPTINSNRRNTQPTHGNDFSLITRLHTNSANDANHRNTRVYFALLYDINPPCNRCAHDHNPLANPFRLRGLLSFYPCIRRSAVEPIIV